MSRWIDAPVWNDATGAELRRILHQEYPTTVELKVLCREAGVPLHEVSWDGSVKIVLSHVLDVARQQAKLKRLVECVGEIPAVSTQIQAILATENADGEWYRARDCYSPRLVGRGRRRA